MGIETAVLVGSMALGGASAIGNYNQSKSDARREVKEGAVVAENRKKEIQQLAARQRVSFLQAGVELEGTPQNVIQDTYNTGIADINNINTTYNQRAKNMINAGRTKLFGDIASIGMQGVSAMGGFGSGVENMAGQSSYNPATTAPTRKPMFTGV